MSDDKASLELHAPAGFWGKINGISSDGLMHFVIIVMIGILIAMVLMSDSDREKRYAGVQVQIAKILEQTSSIRVRQDAIMVGIGEVTQEQQATTYVLTLPQNERRALNLRVPKKIRDRQR